MPKVKEEIYTEVSFKQVAFVVHIWKFNYSIRILDKIIENIWVESFIKPRYAIFSVFGLVNLQ